MATWFQTSDVCAVPHLPKAERSGWLCVDRPDCCLQYALPACTPPGSEKGRARAGWSRGPMAQWSQRVGTQIRGLTHRVSRVNPILHVNVDLLHFLFVRLPHRCQPWPTAVSAMASGMATHRTSWRLIGSHTAAALPVLRVIQLQHCQCIECDLKVLPWLSLLLCRHRGGLLWQRHWRGVRI